MVERRNFGKLQDVIEPPDLISIQTRSYRDFLQLEVNPSKRKMQGLQAVFKEVFPERDQPAAPALVLASERKRLAALTQARPSAQDATNPDGHRAELLEDLTQFAANLPDPCLASFHATPS